MESDKKYYFLFKYGLLFVGLLIWIVPTISWIAPESVEFNGETGSMDSSLTLIFALVGLIPILVFFVIKNKFAIVELGNQTIKIKHNGEERSVNWLAVDSVGQIQFIFPPLYKLKTKDNEDTIWFNTRNKYISINGYTTDISDMGDLINKKKKELGL